MAELSGFCLDRGKPGTESHFPYGAFSRLSHASDLKKWVLSWLTCLVPGVVGSVLGLAGPVSVHCDWVNNKFDLQLLGVAAHTII